MSISKHSRKSGATTVIKDGKIVGNIGKGKTKVPIAQKCDVQQQENFHIAPSTEKSSFTTSQQKMFSLITDNTEYNYTTTVTLWNLTSSQPFADRVKILAQHFDKLSQEEKEQFFVEHLSSEKNYDNISDAMVRKELDEEAYGVLIQHPNPSVRVLILLNANIPLPLLRKAADDPSAQCRCAVASKIPANNYTILNKLAVDPAFSVRESLTHNADLSQSMIRKLGNDTNIRVLEGIARHWNTPVDVLVTLYLKYKNQADREGRFMKPETATSLLLDIAQHPNVSSQILKELTLMDNLTIKNVAQKWLDMQGQY